MTLPRNKVITANNMADGVSAHYLAAFAKVVKRINAVLKRAAKPANSPVTMYIAGGAAQYFYTGARVSSDIDATFSHRIALPEKLEVSYFGADGAPRLLYFDYQYNDTFGLIHEDAHDDSWQLKIDGVDSRKFDVRLFSPLDIAVSKLARYAEHDQADIAALARLSVFNSSDLRARAEEARRGYDGGYVGDLKRIRASINLACRLVDTEHGAPSHSTGGR